MLINQAKNIYYSTQFENNKDDGKKIWRTMDNLLHLKPQISTEMLIIEDKLSTDKGKIADGFNKSFATVWGPDENANQNLPLYDEYLKNLPNASFNPEQVENSAVLHFHILEKIYLIETNMCNCEILNHSITTFPVEFPRDL